MNFIWLNKYSPKIDIQILRLNQTDYFKQLPIFEIQSSQNFPMEQTLVPIMKRKLTSYIYQIVNSEKLNNFDFEK